MNTYTYEFNPETNVIEVLVDGETEYRWANPKNFDEIEKLAKELVHAMNTVEKVFS